MSAIKRLALKIKKEKEVDKTTSNLLIKRQQNKSESNKGTTDSIKSTDSNSTILTGALSIKKPEKTVTKNKKLGKIEGRNKTSVYKKKQSKKNSK